MFTDSILLTIKKLLGLDETNNPFDMDIIIAINSAFFTLHQYGIGDPEAFSITGEAETWQDILGDSKNYEAIKTYVYIKSRLVFDPPSSSFVLTALENQMKEYEWRLWTEKELSLMNASSGDGEEVTTSK